nr:sulfotransferase [uncultured Desulfobacter sp.]
MKVNTDNLGIVNLPDFFIVGAPKSGTTSLHYYLQGHPDIFMPEKKEPWFFSFMNSRPCFDSPDKLPGIIDSLADYVQLYQTASDGQKCGDASPSYLYTHETSIKNLRIVYQDPEQYNMLKFIISLRNPIDRAWSQYWTFSRTSSDTAPFQEAVHPDTINKRLGNNWQPFYDYIGFGMYHDQIKAYQDEFGKDRVKIFLFDDLKKDAGRICKEIFLFLGVDPDYTPDTNQIYNPSGKPKSELLKNLIISPNILKSVVKKVIPKPRRQQLKHMAARKLMTKVEMPAAARTTLKRQFEPEIRRLSRLLDRDLGHWLA